MSEGYATALAFISIHAPREGGDATGARSQHRLGISIHAPARGAT